MGRSDASPGGGSARGAHERSTFALARAAFLALLALCYLVAFASLWVQLDGLIGSRGIEPAAEWLARVATALGSERYLRVPTWFWLVRSDAALHATCAAGVLLAVLALAGVCQRAAFALLWALYLSLVSVAPTFLGFQWEALLLEAGFVALALAPGRFLAYRGELADAPRGPRWLLGWLLFRLMVLSGLVKFLAEPAGLAERPWHELTALRYHYWTQPLPTWTAWTIHQLPGWAQRAACALMFTAELALPFGLVAPRAVRHACALGLALFQVLIAATGNYCYFNLLTFALCVLCFDDHALARLLPRGRHQERVAPAQARAWRRLALAPIALALVIATTTAAALRLGRAESVPELAIELHQRLAPFRVANAYGLFARMTTERGEIEVQGSDDGVEWRTYDFRYKPGDPTRRPEFVAPHQPRLDWQMWFAALSRAEREEWFLAFLVRLLEGEPAVLGLLASNPFPEAPPRYVRALYWQYRFTTAAERAASGAWWSREPAGAQREHRLYAPALELRDGRLVRAR